MKFRDFLTVKKDLECNKKSIYDHLIHREKIIDLKKKVFDVLFFPLFFFKIQITIKKIIEIFSQ